MVRVTASQLRRELFHTLKRVAEGEEVAVNWKGREVARMIPACADWRDSMREEVHLLAPPEEAFAPLDDLWEEHVE